MNPADKPLPSEDPEMDEVIEDAVAPWKDLVPPEVLQEMRERVGDALAAHPDGTRLMRAVRPDPVVQKSTEIDRDTGAPPAPAGGESAELDLAASARDTRRPGAPLAKAAPRPARRKPRRP
jgi:hypothetical protein